MQCPHETGPFRRAAIPAGARRTARACKNRQHGYRLGNHAAPLIQQGNWPQVNILLNNTAAILVLSFAAAFLPVLLYSDRISAHLQFPDGIWMSGGQMIVLIYAAVAVRALFQFGGLSFNAARRFRALAAVSFLQSFVSNCAAIIAAIWTSRVDATLVAYWSAQLATTAFTCLAASRLFTGAVAPVLPRLGTMRELVGHGLKIQVYELAQIINFQFDKFLIASLMGLWAVAPYEVANRSVLALRSIPSSALDWFLATAAIGRESGDDIWPRYESATRLAATAVMVFMVAPLAVAPLFLYAWTGEMGYVARWVFLGLVLGAAGNIIALPAAAMAQAAGRAGLQARSALASMLINIPLSLVLVLKWGLAGAAAGTAIAMLGSSSLLLWQVHRAYEKPLSATMRILWEFWPLLLVCAICAALLYLPFEHWVASLDPGIRYSRKMRVYPAALAGVAYVICLATMAVVHINRGALSWEQYQLLTKWIRFKWFAAYCESRMPVPRNFSG